MGKDKGKQRAEAVEESSHQSRKLEIQWELGDGSKTWRKALSTSDTFSLARFEQLEDHLQAKILSKRGLTDHIRAEEDVGRGPAESHQAAFLWRSAREASV